ncbi:hypothetical protein RJ639_046492 [Escallonia herrerae]|uniref:GBF-interacting protein 1 N-terminal domain-containing protein n=1 Tax=Escallonia herrerae TaxID=1293975 RepID=A0AA88W924_9ASTE|nr:hypothetical protein RJ639_046492 [Escallonia herrerae]
MSGGSRVLIPSNDRGMIKQIREVTAKHSDDEIYAMLKECNMDPDDAAQKLLYLGTPPPPRPLGRLTATGCFADTFHEVKSKRDRRKASLNSRASGTQWRGTRGGRGNYTSGTHLVLSETFKLIHIQKKEYYNVSLGTKWSNATKEKATATLTLFIDLLEANVWLTDAGGGRNVGARKENGNTSGAPRATGSSTTSVNGPTSVSNGTSNGPTRAADGGEKQVVGKPPTEPSSRLLNAVLHETESNATSHVTSASANGLTSMSTWSSSSGPAPQPFAGQCIVDETSAALSVVVSATNGTRPRTSQLTENNLLSEQLAFFPTHNGSLAVIPNPEHVNGISKVVASDPATEAVENTKPLHENDTVLEEATSELDLKLQKLHLSDLSVIFPDNLQVPEAFKRGLTFGSLDASIDGEDSEPVAEAETVQEDCKTEPAQENSQSEPSSCAHGAPSTVEEGDCPDHSVHPPHVPVKSLPLQENFSSASVAKHEQSKPEKMLPLGGPPFPLFQAAPDYSFGLVPPVLAPHLVQLEGSEPQASIAMLYSIRALENGNSVVSSASDSTAPATQPAGISQSSVAIPPHLFPFFRHPYSPNYFPYSHFYPHMYFPHSGHHFLGQSGFPQQPSTGNAYIPPAGAAQGVKFPVSSPFEQGSNAGNMTHFGIPSGYGSYGSSPVSYSPSTAVTPGSSASSEDLAASELKEKNVYLTGEDPHAWTSQSQAVRDISGLQANYLYNQHVAFSHAQAGHGAFGGLFHPSQTTPAASIINPHLHQPQTMPEAIKPRDRSMAVTLDSGIYLYPTGHGHNLLKGKITVRYSEKFNAPPIVEVVADERLPPCARKTLLRKLVTCGLRDSLKLRDVYTDIPQIAMTAPQMLTNPGSELNSR